MFITSNNNEHIKQQIEDTRMKLYKLLDDPKKNPLDLDVLEISQKLDELIAIYLKSDQK